MKYIQSSHFILGIVFLVLNAGWAFSDHVYCDTHKYDSHEPVLRKIVSCPELKTIFFTDGAATFFTGLECRFFLIGSFYRSGLLSLINDPFRCAPGSRIFSETSDFTMKTDAGEISTPSIVFRPYPDYFSVFILSESNDRKISGFDFRLPVISCFSAECVYQMMIQDSHAQETQWFLEKQAFQGIALHNASLKLDLNVPHFIASLCGGLSGSELNPPGWFALVHSTLLTDVFRLSFLSRYRSHYYFTPLRENSNESLGLETVVRFSPLPWFSMEANVGYTHNQTNPFQESYVNDRYEFGTGLYFSFDIAEHYTLRLDASYTHKERWESSSFLGDDSIKAYATLEASSRHHLRIEYSYESINEDEEKTALIQYGMDTRNVELRSQIKYFFSVMQCELAFHAAVKIHGYRVWIETDLQLLNFVPEAVNPFSLNIGLDYSF
ncbi:MAG: hypothetical protein JXD23_04725 [Spirochaetales bacterium]|nr:hypothetical protein [Spirochaetales bacterium]